MTLPAQLSFETLIDRDGVQSGNHATISKVIASVSTIDDVSISVFPTVVQNFLTVNFDNPAEGSKIRILDITGRIINTVPVNVSGQVLINMTDYRQGIYFVDVFNQKSLKVMKVIKQ